MTLGDEHGGGGGGSGISKNYENRRHVSAHSIPINYINVHRCLHSSSYLTKIGVYAGFDIMPRSCSVTSPSLPNGELLLLLLLLLWWHAVGVLLHAVSTRLEHAVRRLLIAVVIRRRLRHISVLQVSRRVGRRRSGVPTHHNSDGPEPWVESSHGDLQPARDHYCVY